jgi:hypothetical protein
MKLPGYPTLIAIALLLGLAPFYPEPHLFQKLSMLRSGTLQRPLDIFDLFWHSWPFGLLLWKLTEGRKRTGSTER